MGTSDVTSKKKTRWTWEGGEAEPFTPTDSDQLPTETRNLGHPKIGFGRSQSHTAYWQHNPDAVRCTECKSELEPLLYRIHFTMCHSCSFQNPVYDVQEKKAILPFAQHYIFLSYPVLYLPLSLLLYNCSFFSYQLLKHSHLHQSEFLYIQYLKMKKKQFFPYQKIFKIALE